MDSFELKRIMHRGSSCGIEYMLRERADHIMHRSHQGCFWGYRRVHTR